jgi:threonine aldolase
VDVFLAVIRELAEEKKKGGFVKPETSQQNGVYQDVYVRQVPAKPNN